VLRQDFWLITLLFSLGCGLIVLARILQLEQAIHGRVFLLTSLVMGAAFLNMAVLWGLFGGWLQKLRYSLRAALIAPFAASGTVAAFIVLFGIHYRLIEGQWNFEDESGDWQHEAYSLVHDTIGLFIGTGLKYFMPWPVLAFGILVCWLIWPKPVSR
jgi:hypothetical protein